MGLDMYLKIVTDGYVPLDDPDVEDNRYLGGWDHYPADSPERIRFWSIVEANNLNDIVTREAPAGYFQDADQFMVNVLYWRKANAIHRWFVDHCQDGVDECQLSEPIHVEQLAELANRCRRVIEDPTLATELLPPQPGFFFGSYEFDEWYFSDLKQTVLEIEALVNKMIALPDRARYHFVYQSSW